MNNTVLTEKEIVETARKCARMMSEKKAKDIVLMDLRRVNNYLDYFLLATGNSVIHCRSLAKEVQKALAMSNVKSRNKSNLDSEWIVLDYNEIVVHIFTQETRDFYQLEKLWGDATVMSYERTE